MNSERPNDLQVGWFLDGDLTDAERDLVERGRAAFAASLAQEFPEIEWNVPVVEGPGMGGRTRPVELVERGVEERDGRCWDFVMVVTAAELIGHERTYILAAPSSSLGVAVLSLRRLSVQPARGEEPDVECTVRRLVALAMHAFGHLGGLRHEDDVSSVMLDIGEPQELDGAIGFSERSRRALRDTLMEVADLRLEEERTRHGRMGFYVRATWRNLRMIASAVLRARPWRLPFRLSKLTTAAISAVAVLVMTSEVWDVALSHTIPFVVAMSLISLVGTTSYIIARQRLFLGSRRGRLTEQVVIMRVATTCVVALGLLTTYVTLFAATIVAGGLVFPERLVASWVSLSAAPDAVGYSILAGFVASLGIVIGALGASFEDQDYVRHVAYIDEET